MNTILNTQISERELIIYLLVESGLSQRDLSRRLGTSQQHISDLYNKGKSKMAKFAEHGLFSTPVHTPVDN